MAFLKFLILCTLLLPRSLSAKEFVVWNVGQGQWSTLVKDNKCLHFDVGGEINVTNLVFRLCSNKLNMLFLSHWDWDHISFVGKLRKKLNNTCLAMAPLGDSTGAKMKLINSIRPCLQDSDELVKIIYRPGLNLKKSNEMSQVVYLNNEMILVPGDSTSTIEKIWSQHVPFKTKGLLLGHHGSKTSTSEYLLKKLPKLKWAVSSARKRKYGHPHKIIENRLKAKKIPILRTEEWGNIHFIYEQ